MSIQRRDFIQKLTWGAAIGAAAPVARSFATPSEPSALLNLTNPIQITGVPKTGMASFDLMITDLMSAWSVPGMALAVSRNGEIIVARGYGLRAFLLLGPHFPYTAIRRSRLARHANPSPPARTWAKRRATVANPQPG